MILADKIAMLRKQSGWSQEDLADQLNVSRQSVSKWESGASIPDLDKILKLSQLFGVSTDYLLKDDYREITYTDTEDARPIDDRHILSLEDADEYLTAVRTHCPKIALAILLFILSPVCLILFGGLTDYLHLLSEDMAGGLGMVILLTVIAVGVAIVLPNGMKLEKYEYLEKDPLSLQYGVQGIVEKKKAEYESTYHRSLVAGVLFCIAGLIQLFLSAAFTLSDFLMVLSTALLLVLIAIGVYIMITPACIYESYRKLLQEGEYTEEHKRTHKTIDVFPGVYWLLVVALYLGISFYYENSWDRTWIVWPVAGVLFAALYGILEYFAKNKK